MDPLREFRWDFDDTGFPAIDRLFRTPAFSAAGDRTARLVSAMDEAYAFHRGASPDYRGIVAQDPRAPARLATLDDVERVPWMFVQNFKEAEILSISPAEAVLTMTSSGTGGQKTRLCLDETSLLRFTTAAHAVYQGLGIVGPEHPAANYLMFTYDLDQAPSLGTAWSDVMISAMVPPLERSFLLRRKGGDGDFAFDLELALAEYTRFVNSGRPLRILGFPAFIQHTLAAAAGRGLPRLPEEAAAGSWVLTGGGWKDHQGEPIPKMQFARFAQEVIGVPAAHVRDLFGMAEHGIGYVDCEHGRLHVPVYAHARARDPFTLRLLPGGSAGMLHLWTPLLRSTPSLSLLTTDAAIVHQTPCPCGRPGDGLEFVGRLGRQKHEGCAIRALTYLSSSPVSSPASSPAPASAAAS